MGKFKLEKPNENEPLNKKFKSIKLNEQNVKSITELKKSTEPTTKLTKSKESTKPIKKNKEFKKSKQINSSPNQNQKKEKIDKSTKLKAKEQPKSEDLKAQRQLRREKKKLSRLNKKKNENKKKQTKEESNSNLNSNELKKKNQHLNNEERLNSILNEKENNKTIINHYKNLIKKVNGEKQINGFIKKIKEHILDEKLDKELRNYLINDLNRFITNNQIQNDLLINIMKFTALNSFFSLSTNKEDDQLIKNLELDTLNCFKNSFIKNLNLIIRSSMNKKKKIIEKIKLDSLYQIMKYIYTIMNSDESNPLKDDFNSIFKKISNSYKQIQLKDDNLKEQTTLFAFFLFYVFLGINLFEQQQNSLEILDEINECFKRFTLSSTSTEKSKKDDDLYWADVFTDILLALLSDSNSLKRTICDEVFSLISKEITKTGLEQLMNALISDNIEISDNEEEEEEFMDAKDELSNEEEDEEEEEMEDENSENEEVDLDVDENCLDESKEEEEEEKEDKQIDGEESEEESESEDSESDTESIDDEFRLKIREALGKAAVEEESEDEIIYDDDQMLEFDEAISNVFKEKKKLKNKAHELTEFKSRCFDLVQLLVKDSNLEHLIEVAKNSLEVLKSNNTTKSFDLIVKASTTLKKYPTIEQEKLTENDKQLINENLVDLLNRSLYLVKKVPEKVRSNLNCFIIWLLDLGKFSNQTETIENLMLDKFEKKLKKSSEVSLFTMLAERKKELAKLMFKRLIKLELDIKKSSNFELYSYFKLLIECSLNSPTELKPDESTKLELNKILDKSIDLINIKKKEKKKSKYLVDELFRFLSIFIKNHLNLVKEDCKLLERIYKLNNEANHFKLSKKLRQKWKSTLNSLKTV